MVVIIAYLVAFSIIFYQTRRALQEVNASKIELIGNFLLVVEELEEKTALTTTIEDLAQRMTAIESQLSMDTNSIMTKMTAMETEMTNILKGMRQEMTSMKAELSKSEK